MSPQRSPGFLRYYQRDRLELTCRLLTPLFLGNARQETEWRAAPFKALMRYWWRVAQVDARRPEELLAREAALFGAAGEAGEQKSLITLRVAGTARPQTASLGVHLPKVRHPEVGREGMGLNPLLYLAGMGLMQPNGQVNRPYFATGGIFNLILDFPSPLQQELKPTLALMAAFGALGARCRNGWGSFQIEDGLPWGHEELRACLSQCSRNWQDGFAKDYPNCLGLEGKKPLLWQTKSHNSWDGAMRELAEAYIAIRAGNDGKKIRKLDPGPGFAERHLLGVPLTNHAVNIERHASPLRFVIRQSNRQFQGFVLHVPFRFAGAPNSFPPQRQMEVWQKVHQGLDQILGRAASYGECL